MIDIDQRRALSRPAKSIAITVASALVLSSCGSTGPTGGSGTIVASDATASNVARVGFLSDYSKLAPSPGSGGMLCWRDANINWKSYDKVLIERIQVYLKPGGAQKPVDPTDLKVLIDYFHNAWVKDLRPEAQIVNATGPAVFRMRIALTSLVPTNTVDSLVGTAVPYGFVAEIGSGAATGRPAGSTPYMGQTGMEVQFRDGGSGRVIAECADTEIGRKYAADLNHRGSERCRKWMDGYLDSFTSWSDAQDAFNKWASEFAKRFNALRNGSA